MSDNVIASIELNSEYQLVKQQWDSTIETENMWWLDNEHIMLLSSKYIIIKEKLYNSAGSSVLDDWNGDQWSVTKKYTRSSYIPSTVLKYGVSSVYGSVASSDSEFPGAVFYTLETVDTSHFRLRMYMPLNDMASYTVKFEIKELNYGEALSQVTNVLSMYNFMSSYALLSNAEISMTHVGYKIILGIHVDKNLLQWSFVFDCAAPITTVARKITGYGYVAPNGSLTGGQFPSDYVSNKYGFYGSVKFINDLVDYSNNSINGEFTTNGIYGTQEQQWYIQRKVKKICSHITFSEATDVRNGRGGGYPFVLKYLPLQSNYSAEYVSPSFIVNRITGFMPQPTTLGAIFDFGDASVNTLVNVLTAIASPSIWFLNICWTKFGFLEQSLGQYAYTYKCTDKQIQIDRTTFDIVKEDSETPTSADTLQSLLNTFKGSEKTLTQDALSFDKQEREQTCTTKSTSNGGINTFWLSLLQAGISAINNASVQEPLHANDINNVQSVGQYAKSFSQFALQNALNASATDFGINKTNDIVLASKVTAVKTLDMFYSTSANSEMYAGAGYVCHNFIGYCVAQSTTNRFLTGSQNSMFTALSFLSTLSLAIRNLLLKALADLLEKIAESTDGAGTYALGTGTTWGSILAASMRAGQFVAKKLIASNDFFADIMPKLLQTVCPGFPNPQFSNSGSMSSHDIDIEAKHYYGSKHVTFMWPCFGCESTYFTKESVQAVVKDVPVKVDFTPQNNSIASSTKGKINLYTSGIANVTSPLNKDFSRSLYDNVYSEYVYAQGASVVDTVPPDTAVIEGVTTFLPTVPFKNENIDINSSFSAPPTQDFMLDSEWGLGITATTGGVAWVSVKDTKLLDGGFSNVIITDDFCGIGCPYTVIELKKQIEKEYLRPCAITPNALAWNITGLNTAYGGEIFHGFDGFGYRITSWKGTSGMGTEYPTLAYSFQENNHLKRSNILPPNHFYGNFVSLPSTSIASREHLYQQIEIDSRQIGTENLTSAENKNLMRFSIPIFTESLSTMPSVVKTLSSYKLLIIDGVTSLTSDTRLTQNTYKIPKSIDFNINKQLYRATDEYVNALNDAGLSVGDLTSKMGLEFIGATPTQAFFYSEATRAYYSFTGASMIQKQDVWNRFKDIKDGKWDFVNQDVVFQCIGNMTRVMDGVVDGDEDLTDNIFIAKMSGQKPGITGEIAPPVTTIFNNSSWFKTYSFAGGFAFQGPNRFIVNRFIVLDYMIEDIVNNKAKWAKVSRDEFYPFRKYNEEYATVDDRIGDTNDYTYTLATAYEENVSYYYYTYKVDGEWKIGLYDAGLNGIWKKAYSLAEDTFEKNKYYTRKLTDTVVGWTHNPFLLATAPLGVDEETDCVFEWDLTFTWTDEMDKIYGNNEYACVNIMAQTMCPGGKKRTEPTHLYLHKQLFTRGDNTGYYSFKFSSRNGAGNREQLFIWSDAYIAMTGLSLNNKIVTSHRTMPLATSQIDIKEMEEF